MSNAPIWQAETCATGGYLCGHQHRTRKAAERCLPRVPPSPSGSLTRNFSMARIISMNAAAHRCDVESIETEDFS